MASTDLGIVLEKPLGESFQAALPNKLFDFMHAGIPVLTGDGLPEVLRVIREVPFGVSVQVNPTDIARAVLKVMESPAQRAAMCKLAQAHAHSYSWEKECSQVLAQVC